MLRILQGDWIGLLETLSAQSIHCCVTSPPYWGLRDYGVAGQLGLEKTPEEYVVKLVEGFREVRRVLREDGTLWLNLGDSYAGYWGDKYAHKPFGEDRSPDASTPPHKPTPDWWAMGIKPKDLVGIPWRVAFALQADGWYLRSDIIWHKPNPMPESVTDRPTKAHEYIFLLTKSPRYFYDHEAIKEAPNGGAHARVKANGPNSRMILERAAGRENSKPNPSRSNVPGVTPKSATPGLGIKMNTSYQAAMVQMLPDRNKRTVWTVPSQAYPESHFATFPEDLIKPCILAGTSAKGCCPKCGAPWVRILEKQSFGKDDYNGKHSKGDPTSAGRNILASVKAARANGGDHDNPFPAPKTIGWAPSCECGCPDTQPCTVLDPFGGSGTTGQVALELGRKAILIELNPKYVQLIEQRTSVTPGLPLA